MTFPPGNFFINWRVAFKQEEIRDEWYKMDDVKTMSLDQI